MKNLFYNIIMIVFFVTTLQSCGQHGVMKNETGGVLIGGIAGGLLGSQFGKGGGKVLMTGVGALTGALVGSHIGSKLDKYDQQLMQQSANQALEFSPSGTTTEWHNPDSGHSGAITPVKTFKQSNQFCREYVQEIMVGGEKQKAYGKACRQPDGHWKIVN